MAPQNEAVDSLASILSHAHFVVVTLHSSSSSAPIPDGFLTWLGQCCVSLCNEIHAAIPYLRLSLYPSVLVPAGTPAQHPQTLRFLISVDRQSKPGSQSLQSAEERGIQEHEADEDDAALSTRLTCGLQAFLKQLRLHPRFLKTAGYWLNARYVTRADLGALESFIEYSSVSSEDGADTTKQQQHHHREDAPLPAPALSAIGAALRIAPEPNSPPAIVPHSALQPTAQYPAPSADAGAMPPRAKAKLRPVTDVLDRLRWDDSLGGTAAYIVGYRDRFDGVLELALDHWVAESTDEEWIPSHRISYVKRSRDGALVWWREGRIDLIFHSGNGTGENANVQR